MKKKLTILLFLFLLSPAFSQARYHYYISMCVLKYPVMLEDGFYIQRGGVYFEVNMQNRCYAYQNKHSLVYKYFNFKNAVLRKRELNTKRDELYSYKPEQNQDTSQNTQDSN